MSDILLPKQVITAAEESGYSVAIPSTYTTTPYPFRPVKCTEEDIKNGIAPTDNFVYFTTDTKKIFFGQQGKFLPMCASTGFFYGLKDIAYDNSGVTPDPNVDFYLVEIEGDELPEVDDLILNMDGCFYRVTDVVDEVISTKRLTLQGTGGGGGGGGSTDVGNPGYALIMMNKALIYAANATTLPFTFSTAYSHTAQNNIAKISFYKGTGKNRAEEPFYVINQQMALGIEHTIDLIECKQYFSNVNEGYTIAVQDIYNTERSTAFTLQLVDLALSSSETTILTAINAQSYIYGYAVAGATSARRELIVTFYPGDDMSNPISTQTFEVSMGATGEVSASLDLSDLHLPNVTSTNHGVYTMKVEAVAHLSRPLYSNTLMYKMVCYDNSVNQPLLAVLLPQEIQQFTNIPVTYKLIQPDANRQYTLDIAINDDKQKSLKLMANTTGTYNLYFDRIQVYTLTCTVPELNSKYETTLNVQKYTGLIPVIDTARHDLLLYLNPRGKSNDETSRAVWGSSTQSETHQANLIDFHYGTFDGWLSDEYGTPYLKLASGAKLAAPTFKPFSKDPTVPGADSRYGKGMTIELDFEINGTLDYDAELIKCISYTNGGYRTVGFSVTGNKVCLYNNRMNGAGDVPALISSTLVEGQRIRVSFVIEKNEVGNSSQFPMAYIYLNGILSNAVIYDKADKFIDFISNPATLEIDSTYAQLKVYGIRFYTSALSHQDIVNNYIASLDTLAEKEEAYHNNNVYSAGKINYASVADINYDLQVPYMTITGGWKTETESKWQLLGQTAANVGNNPGLPTGKKDYRLIDVEVKYPKTPLFEGYKDFAFTNTFKTDKPMSEQFGQKPSNGGAIMYAQGTSSMEYPVKNLRLRFKNEEDWFNVRPDIADVEIICMKADYMESSGSHNTGAANFIDDLYASARLATPGQEHFNPNFGDNDLGTKNIVTCIKGHPCLIFYRRSPEENYEYIGKYNLNLDKATPEPFGFNHDNSDFGYLTEGDKYYQIPYDEEDEYIGVMEDYGPSEVEATVQAGDKVNAIHCFEFLDNAVAVCNFLNMPKAERDEDGNEIPEDQREYYSYEETWYKTFTVVEDGKQVQKPGWTLGFESRYPEDKVGYHDADALYPLASWINELHYLKQTNHDLAINRFKKEYLRFFNHDFLLTYYLITEALLMADSRTKNMMIATWGKEDVEYEDVNGVIQKERNYIWYPIFYDMDTMLGLDNTGVYRFNYYEEDTQSDIYNGQQVLWHLVREAFSAELPGYFSGLETSLNEQVILNYMSVTQADLPNQAFYNGDADYKYLRPAREGYHDHLYDKEIAPGSAPYLYAAQGSRSLMREWWLTNRMKYLRGKYTSGRFVNGDRVEFRWYYPSEHSTDEKLAASYRAVKPDGNFTFTSLQTGYAGAQLGKNAGNSTTVERFSGEETKTLTVPNAVTANGTESYIFGLSNLTSLGDLSNKYMQKFILASGDIRLKELILGNGHKDYYNPYWKQQEGSSIKIGLDAAYYLQKFNLQNCSTYNNSLDFSQCPAIETILLTGSSTSGITLPEGGIVKELRLPATMTSLTIHNHPYLAHNKFSMGIYDYAAAGTNTITREDCYRNDFSRLSSIDIVGTPLLNTYEIVRNAVDLSSYNLPEINWEISEQDIQVVNGVTYKLVNDDQTITCIPILEKLMALSPLGTSQKESLTGTITINVSGAVANEFALYEKYILTTFPNLELKYGSNMGAVTQANSVYFYAQDADEYKPGIVPYYSLKHNGTKTWGYVRDNVPTPEKTSTHEYDYWFDGEWVDVNNPTNTYNIYHDTALLDDVLPAVTELHLAPRYQEGRHEYSITFYDDNGKDVIIAASLDYNTTSSIEERLADRPLYFHYKEPTGLASGWRWALKGWISKQDFDNKVQNPQYIDLSTQYVMSDRSYYAYYAQEDATITPTDSRCFYFANSTDSSLIAHETQYAGYSITPKQAYETVLQGAITLPATTPQGDPIVQVGQTSGGGLFGNTKITELYLEKGSQYKVFGRTVCKGLKTLTAVHFTDTVVELRQESFSGCPNLEHTGITAASPITYIGNNCFRPLDGDPDGKVRINELPSGLTYLGMAAFWRSGPNVRITYLPRGLRELPSYAFYSCPGVAITTFGGNSVEDKLTILGAGCLSGCGTGVSGFMEPVAITIGSSVVTISPNTGIGVPIFDNYKPGGFQKFSVTAPRNEDGYNLPDGTKSNLGHWFKADENIKIQWNERNVQ